MNVEVVFMRGSCLSRVPKWYHWHGWNRIFSYFGYVDSLL